MSSSSCRRAICLARRSFSALAAAQMWVAGWGVGGGMKGGLAEGASNFCACVRARELHITSCAPHWLASSRRVLLSASRSSTSLPR